MKENVLQRMERIGAEKRIADFNAKMSMPYKFKKKYAAVRAREFVRECDARGLNYHVSVGGLDSITLLLFLRSLHIDAPAISVSYLEDVSIQRVHRALGVECMKPLVKEVREDGREGYRKWLTAPELTPCGADAHIDYTTYSGIVHRCDDMPEGVYFWENEVCHIHGGQFWVMAHEGEPAGEQMDVCPYCKADLCHGEGQRYLRKAAGYVFSEASYRKHYGLDEIDELERRCAV